MDRWEEQFATHVQLIDAMDPKVLTAGGMSLQQLNDQCQNLVKLMEAEVMKNMTDDKLRARVSHYTS